MNKIKTIRFKGAIFDLDGTLAGTLEDISDSMNKVLFKHGFPSHDYKSYKNFVGRGIENLVISSLPEEARKPEIISVCLDLMIKEYRDNCLSKTKLYPGINEMLDQLKEYDIKLGVLSNKTEELTKKIVKALLGKWDFDAVVGERSGMPRKPDPAGALLISNIFGISTQDIFFLGDSAIDMITANRAGMSAVGVTWGFRSKEELMENGADALLERPEEIITILSGV